MEITHIVCEVIVASCVILVSQIYFWANGSVSAKIAIVGISTEILGCEERNVRTKLESDSVAWIEGCLNRYCKHPLLHACEIVTVEISFHGVTTFHNFHVVFLDGGINFHALVLEAQS